MPEENVTVKETKSPPPHLDKGEDIVVRTIELAGLYQFGGWIEFDMDIKPSELSERTDFAYYLDGKELFPKAWASDGHALGGLTMALVAERRARTKVHYK